jgi:hypothetical protein
VGIPNPSLPEGAKVWRGGSVTNDFNRILVAIGTPNRVMERLGRAAGRIVAEIERIACKLIA